MPTASGSFVMSPLETLKIAGFKRNPSIEPALLKTGNADEILLVLPCLGAFLPKGLGGIIRGPGHWGYDNLKIAVVGLSRGLADDVIRHDGGLSAAARCIDYKGRHTIAAGMTAQPFDNLYTLAYRGTEMGETHGEIAYIDIVWTNTDLNEPLNKLLHYMHAVIDACKQHALIAKGDARIRKHFASALALFCYLIRMVEMGIEPNGMILLQHCAELRSDPLGTDNGGAGAYAHDLHMGHLAKLADDIFEPIIILHERIAAGEQNIAHLGMVPDIFKTCIDLLGGHCGIMLTRKPSAGAVAAIHGALIRDEEQHPVRVTMSQPRNGRIGILMQRIELILGSLIKLCCRWDALTADGIEWIIRVYK